MANQSTEMEGQLQAEEAILKHNHLLVHSTLNDMGHELTSQTSTTGGEELGSLESRAEEAAAAVQYRTLQHLDREEDEEDWKWSDAEGGGKASDCSPSDPSSEGEEGYILLPQDAEQGSTLDGDRESHTVEEQLESLELNSVEAASPRMSKWLQKHVDDINKGVSSSSSRPQRTDWARFSVPAPYSGSQDWPSSASTLHRIEPVQTAVVGKVEPVTIMEEGI